MSRSLPEPNQRLRWGVSSAGGPSHCFFFSMRERKDCMAIDPLLNRSRSLREPNQRLRWGVSSAGGPSHCFSLEASQDLLVKDINEAFVPTFLRAGASSQYVALLGAFQGLSLQGVLGPLRMPPRTFKASQFLAPSPLRGLPTPSQRGLPGAF